MARCAEDDATLGLFHQLAEVHHQHAVADMADDSQIVRNERSEEHTSELQSLMRISYAVFCLKKKKKNSYLPLIMQQTKPTYISNQQNMKQKILVTNS